MGEPSPSVRDFLTANGISDIDADAKIKELNAERNREIRKLGGKKTIFGAVLLVGAGIFFCFSLKHVNLDRMDSYSARAFVGTAIVVAIAGFYGLSKLIDGIIYLVRPQSEEKAISEM